ncbi:MAG: cytochrome C biogenesis protein [Candidatus Omnitrophica bacterium CG11_big_fil_rev_8_21_14_0_20_64_10]|nr:MAG: cytochrome C biogenesis protein [Candidatus Omnitrophica bacterium CG11_big_fil_rev_8_21_14_0_20_64_10]
MTGVNFLTAAVAGVVSFLSPCVLPLIPGYISFISGVSLSDLQTADSHSAAVRRAFVSSVWFVLGFAIVFTLMGATATAVGSLLVRQLALFRIAAGMVIIGLGVHLIGIVRIPFLQAERRFELKRGPVHPIGALLIGAAFAFGWTPCIGPILAGILALAATQETVGQGMALLAVYSLGLGVPFLLTSLGVQAFLRFFARFKRYLRVVEILSGILLVGIGVLILTDRLTGLIQYFGFFNRFAL